MELKIYNQSGILKLTVSTASSSTLNQELMTENAVSASFTHPGYVPLDVNDYVTLLGVKYSIKREYKPKQKNTQTYDYSVKFYAPEHDAQQVMYLNLTDGQYNPQFSLDGSPREHMQKWVDNMNRIYGSTLWSIGDVVVADNQTIEYNNLTCWDALTSISEAFGTEWWADGFVMNLSRCEHGEQVELGYMQGLTSLTQSENSNDVKFFTRLIPLGSTKNIDRSRYGYTRLQLPDKSAYVDRNTHYGLYEHVEEAAFAEIFPHYTGIVTSVRSEEKTGEDKKPFTVYYFKDDGMGFDPSSKENEIGGLVKHVSFQTGDLAGRDFEANYNSTTKEWEIINTYPSDDVQIPGGNLIPEAGNKYIPWNFRMPAEYEVQAEKDFKAAVDDFLVKYSDDISKYGGDTDYIYVDKNNVSLSLGQRVRLLSEKYFATSEGYRDTRLTKVVRKLDNLSIATIECTNQVGKGWKSQVDSSLADLKYVVAVQKEAEIALDILKSWDGRDLNDYRVLSALRTLMEIKNRAISRVAPDIAQEIIIFLRGIETNGIIKALAGLKVAGGISTDSLAASGDIAGKNISASETVSGKNVSATETVSGKNINATKKVSAETVVAGGAVKGNYVDATEDVSGKNVLASEGVGGKTVTATDTVKGNHVQAVETVSGKNASISNKVTTLNLLVQALADIYDLNVSHVATLFRTIVKDYISSEQFIPGFTGNGMKLYKALNGDWNLELDNLTVRKAMTVFELIISKIRAVNGGLVISPANGKVKSVLLTNGLYRLEIEDDMMFVADDLVRCQSFSVKSGVKYYWVRITSVSGSYIFINATEFTNSLPAIGDDLVQFGNKTNKLRQGLLYLTAAEDGKPRISVLDGVNSTDLTGKTKVILGCLDDIVDSDFSADSQPSGYGLYAQNVFLKGMFILRSGKTVESELDTTNAAVKAAKSVADAAKTAAGTAQTTANTAVTNAATANTLLADLASDNKLTATEKQQTKKEWDAIVSEKVKNDASADKFGVSKTAYGTAYAALNTYITPLLTSLTTTSNIVGTDFRAKFKSYYDARTNLLNTISEKAKTLADTAQSKADSAATAASTVQTKANEAFTAAGSAQTAANNAQTSANGANALLTDIASDNKLTPAEKQSTKKEWDIIVSEKPLNNASAVKFGVATTAYDTVYSTLNTYITPLLASLTTTSNITGTDFRAKFKAYYDARTNLLNSISAKAKSLADDAQSSVDNLRVGGRNLLLNSKVSKSGTAYNIGNWNATRDFSVGEKLTATIKGNIPGSKLFGIWFNTGTFGGYSLVKVEDGIYSITFKVPAGTSTRTIGIYLKNNQASTDSWTFDWIKLETGNRRTDWTPAPEEIETKITEVETRFEVREGQISAKITEVTTKATQAATSATNAKTSETNASGSATTAGQKATAAANSATAASGSATSAKKSADDAGTILEEVTVKESSITQTAGQIATKVTEVNTKVTEANTAATNAKKSETNAGSSATAAGQKATAASGSAGTAATKAGEAATSATNAKASADSASSKLTTIIEKESSINQTAGSINLKVTEVTKKATEAATSATNAKTSETNAGSKATAAGSSATAAAGSATTAGTKAGEAATSATNAKNSADSAAAKLTTITQKESSINQTASNITLQVTEVTTKASQASTSAANASNAAELAMAMSQGKMLYRDPSFEKGSNGIAAYNNSSNGAVTVARVSGVAGNPNGSGYCLKITTTAAASPNWGGFYWGTSTKANQILVVRFIANIPTGRTLGFATNGIGTGNTHKWLTSNAGTGGWEEYAYKINCGSTGTFSSTAFFALQSGTTPTASSPLIWYLSYATVYDVTDAEVDYIADAAGKYTTKTEHSSSITQLSDKIELKVAKTDFNALGNRVSNAETTITQHTGQIALKAAQSDVTALGTRVSAAELKITPDAIRTTVKSQTDSIAASAASDAVDALQVGGRNYFISSDRKITYSGGLTYAADNVECPYGFYAVGDQDGTNWLRISKVITSNGWWTVSWEMRGSQNTAVYTTVDVCDIGGVKAYTTNNNTWKKYSLTVNVTNYGDGSIFNFVDFSNFSWAYFFVRNIKVEQGNKSTDWTPAPEDVEADAQSKADAAKNAAISDSASKYTTKTTYESGITQLGNQIATKVASTTFNALGQRVSSAETTITQHTNQISLKAAQADVTALGTRMSSAEAKITPDAIKLTVKSQTDSIVSAAVKRTEVWVDATGLDQSKYYPLTMVLNTAVGTYMISVDRILSTSYGKPSWSTHAEGFSVLCRWTTNACGWGGRDVKRTILDYTSSFAGVVPVGSIGQLTNSSQEYIYVRGGSKYRVVVEGATGVDVILRTSDYTHSSSGYTQSAPLLTSVTTPVPDITAVNTRITNVETSFEIREGQISSKVSQATTSATTATTKASEAAASAGTAGSKATTAGNSASAAAGSATTAGTKAGEAATSATNARKSADDAATKLVTITQKETSINQTANSINLKATEVTTKAGEAATSANNAAGSASTANSKATAAGTSATNAASSASAASGSATTAGQKAAAAANSASDAAAKLATITTKETSINQTASQITIQASTVTTKTAEAINAAELAAAMSKGRMLYRDPTFESGLNGTGGYALAGSRSVVAITGCPNRLAKGLKTTVTGWVSATDLRAGGFSFSNQSRSNAVFVVRIVANIPAGRNIQNYHNDYGTGGTTKWLTSQAGTGKWQEYACKVTCGASGTFGTINHFALTGGVTPTAAAPVVWYVAYATVFDTTDVDDVPTVDEIKAGLTVSAGKISIFGRDISIAGMVTFEGLTAAEQLKFKGNKGDKGETGATGFKGDKGDIGPVGSQGIAGTSQYFHVRYSASSNGNPMTTTPNTYIGTAVTSSSAAPTAYTSYIWVQFKGSQGPQGTQGIAGAKGSDGRTPYLHIKYSDNGTSFTANNGETPGAWIGQYTDFIITDSTTFSAYTWTKVKGDTGAKGDKGATGDRGPTGYLDTAGIASLKNDVALKLGYTSFTDMEAKATAGQTIVTGGKIRTTLIDARAIVTGALVAELVAANDIKTNKLTVTNGAKIGNFLIADGGLYAENTVAIIGMVNSSYTTHMSAGQIVIDHPSAGNALVVNGGLCDVIFDIKNYTLRAGGVYNAPGVLWAGRINRYGSVESSWGYGAGYVTCSREGRGIYRFSHSLNHNSYYVMAMATPYAEDDSDLNFCMIKDKGATYFHIHTVDAGRNWRDMAFEVCIVGNN